MGLEKAPGAGGGDQKGTEEVNGVGERIGVEDKTGATLSVELRLSPHQEKR